MICEMSFVGDFIFSVRQLTHLKCNLSFMKWVNVNATVLLQLHQRILEMLSSKQIKVAKAFGYFNIFRNLTIFAVSWTFFWIKRDQVELIPFLVSRASDVYLLFSYYSVFKLFEGLKLVSQLFLSVF